MSTPAEIEARRTAIAIVRAQIEGDSEAGLALLRGTEDPGEVMSALVAFTAELVQVLGGENWRELLDKLAVAAVLDE